MRRQGGFPPRCSRVFFIDEHADAPILEQGALWREGTGLLGLLGHAPGRRLARFDVRLIEGIDSQDGSRHGGGDLPSEKPLAQVSWIGYVEAHHGLARA